MTLLDCDLTLGVFQKSMRHYEQVCSVSVATGDKLYSSGRFFNLSAGPGDGRGTLIFLPGDAGYFRVSILFQPFGAGSFRVASDLKPFGAGSLRVVAHSKLFGAGPFKKCR